MLRSHSQVLYGFLPGAVFRHEERVYGQVLTVDGPRLTGLNEPVVYEEIARYVEQWPDQHRHDLPLPRDMRVREYCIIKPGTVRWKLWPMVFECSRRACGRVRSVNSADDLAKHPRCKACGGTLQQLRFYSAHNCGATKAIFVPKCSTHGYDDIFFDNTGSFLTATWRCRGAGCNGGVVQRTNMSPCSCKDFPDPSGASRMRAHTLDDSRAYQPHFIDLVNIDSSEFKTFQGHSERGPISIAHFLGLIDGIKQGMRDADTGSDGKRMSHAEWQEKDSEYRQIGLSESDIETLRRSKGPVETGLAALGNVSPLVLETVATQRAFYERAAVFDRHEVPRITLEEQLQRARERADTLQAESLAAALDLGGRMGISELAVTWDFPIAKVAFGYTRERHQPGEAAIRGFRNKNYHDGKYPLYAVNASTEALLVTLSPSEVLGFLFDRGEIDERPSDDDAARRQLLEVFAEEAGNPAPAATIRTLVHTFSHLLLRGMDDGQIGFAESSLAEWMVPETLTFGIYANTLKAFTLGSLWTLLNNRALSWLNSIVGRTVRCENDPLCYQSDPRSCERCAYLTFGCRLFNEGLDRKLLYDFLLPRGVLSGVGPATP